jgi:hypothetical protein
LAYIEFAEIKGVRAAMETNDSMFFGRPIGVIMLIPSFGFTLLTFVPGEFKVKEQTAPTL